MSDLTEIRIDYTRIDIERRFALLEMTDGDLKRAMELERWVQFGQIYPFPAQDRVIEP